MNMKFVKRMLAATLAATLMVAPALTVGATTNSSSSSNEESSNSDSNSGSTEAAVVTEALPSSTVSVGGTVIKSQVNGAYAVKTLAGVAVRQGNDAIKAAAGLGKSETPFARVYDITAKKSPRVFDSFNGAAAAAGGVVLGAVNFDLGKMAGGKFADLPADVSVPVTFGVKNANGRTLSVIKVVPGGATTILTDTDENPNTVTVPVTGGLAAYAIMAN
jgi:hypothetical protein